MEQDEIMRILREATAPVEGAQPTALPDLPPEAMHTLLHPEGSDPESLWLCFCNRFAAVNGRPMTETESCARFLNEQGCLKGFVAPELSDRLAPALIRAGIEAENTFDPDRLDDYAFGITWAAGIIAETGTVILKESSTASRLAALAPWTHIAVLTKDSRLYPNLMEAIDDLGDDPYVVFATGPSKTADVEGILIEGVHGPGEQVCLRLDETQETGP